mmetsp:Transcript_47818/g.138257  ORF Transcript_47818/g.138257 Transcript_47818/m.138257 type:complete len:556 (+) Transcript_47818:618-2285(+)
MHDPRIHDVEARVIIVKSGLPRDVQQPQAKNVGQGFSREDQLCQPHVEDHLENNPGNNHYEQCLLIHPPWCSESLNNDVGDQDVLDQENQLQDVAIQPEDTLSRALPLEDEDTIEASKNEPEDERRAVESPGAGPVQEAPVLHGEEQDGYDDEAPVEDGDGLEEDGDAAGVRRALVVTPLEARCPHGLRHAVPGAPHLGLYCLSHCLHGGLSVVLLGRGFRLRDAFLHSISDGCLDLPDRDLLLGGHDDAAGGDEDVAAVYCAEHTGKVGHRAVDVHLELQPHLASQRTRDALVVRKIRERAVDLHAVRAALGPVRGGAPAPRDDGDAGATRYRLRLHRLDLVERKLAGTFQVALALGLGLDGDPLALQLQGQVALAHAQPAVPLVHAPDRGAPEGNGPGVPVLANFREAVGDAFAGVLQVAVVHKVVRHIRLAGVRMQVALLPLREVQGHEAVDHLQSHVQAVSRCITLERLLDQILLVHVELPRGIPGGIRREHERLQAAIDNRAELHKQDRVIGASAAQLGLVDDVMTPGPFGLRAALQLRQGGRSSLPGQP